MTSRGQVLVVGSFGQAWIVQRRCLVSANYLLVRRALGKQCAFFQLNGGRNSGEFSNLEFPGFGESRGGLRRNYLNPDVGTLIPGFLPVMSCNFP